VSQSVIALADRELVVPVALPSGGSAGGDLLELFGLVTDGRPGQGRDHPVAAVLALAAAATVAGMKGYTAIAGWVKDVPPPVLADLYMRAGASPARPPSKTTIWRAVTDADAEVFDAMVGRWLVSCQAAGEGEDEDGHPAGLVPVRLDGKTIRGAKDDEGNQRHLLAAMAGPDAATWPSAPCAWPGAPTSPKPPGGPAGPWTGHSPSSASPNDLETAVPCLWTERTSGSLSTRPPMPAQLDR
jgi:hypothetical protein